MPIIEDYIERESTNDIENHEVTTEELPNEELSNKELLNEELPVETGQDYTEQLDRIVEQLDNLLSLTAELLAFSNFLNTVLIPLIAIVCLLWLYFKIFINR